MCAKRSGVVKRLKARKAELLKLLNSGNAISWNISVKLHAEVKYIKNLLTVRKNSKYCQNYKNIASTTKNCHSKAEEDMPG